MARVESFKVTVAAILKIDKNISHFDSYLQNYCIFFFFQAQILAQRQILHNIELVLETFNLLEKKFNYLKSHETSYWGEICDFWSRACALASFSGRPSESSSGFDQIFRNPSASWLLFGIFQIGLHICVQ